MVKETVKGHAKQIRGVSYKPNDLHGSLDDNSVILLRANNIDDGKINFDDVVYVDKSKVSNEQYLRRGDVLICASSGSKQLVGKAASVDFDTPCTFGAFCKVVRPNTGWADYLGIYFQSNVYRREISALAIGANINNIRNEHVDCLPLNIWSDDKQKRIVNQMSKLKGIIDKRKDELAKMDELIKARFVEMFGSVYDNEFEKKTIPEFVLNDKNAIKRGPFGGALKKEDFVKSGYLVYEQRHAIHEDFEYEKYYISSEKYEEMIGFKVLPKDLIISCSGVTLGRIAEIPEGAKEGIINQALLKLSLDQSKMMNKFFIQQFRGEEIQDILFGFSRGSGIPNMPSMNEVKAVKFICPPIELQNQFCRFVEQVDKSKSVVQRSLDETQLLIDSLMQEYFG